MLPDVTAHMQKVNGWSRSQLENALDYARDAWEQRCEWPWTVNLDWIHASGYLYV